MTVKELKEKLNEYSDDLEVVITMDDDFFRYYAKLYAERFSIYLGGVSRHIMNMKLHDIPYQE